MRSLLERIHKKCRRFLGSNTRPQQNLDCVSDSTKSERSLAPFHLAIPVDDLAKAEAFYGGVMGCAKGRQSERWIDFNFFGHQLVTHLAPEACGRAITNEVDGKQVPAKHFGVVLGHDAWRALADRLEAAHVDFIIEPGIRFAGEAGEQGTFFFLDPAGNALEFKCFKDMDQLFAI